MWFSSDDDERKKKKFSDVSERFRLERPLRLINVLLSQQSICDSKK